MSRKAKSTKTAKALDFIPATQDHPAMITNLGDLDDSKESKRMIKENKHLSPAQMKDQLTLVCSQVRALSKVARALGQNKSITIKGDKIGPKEVNYMTSRLCKEIMNLQQNYVARGTKKQRGTTNKDGSERKVGKGFEIPSFLNEPLQQFLLNADFGTAPDGTPVRDVFADFVQEYPIFSRAITTPLMVIYRTVHNLSYTVPTVNAKGKTVNKKFYKVDPTMVKYFGPWIEALEQEQAAGPERVGKNGVPLLRFNRNKFGYNQMQQIITEGFRRKGELNEQELEYVNNEEIQDRLKNILTRISALKEQMAPNEK